MMIFVTWTEKRGWMKGYGKPLAALWAREGGRKELKAAEAYAAKHEGMKVYATSKYELFAVAKTEALKAHEA